MNLHGLVYYRSNSEEWTDDWSSSDYAARNLVAAIKQRAFNGYSYIKVGNDKYRIENTSTGQKNALIVAGRVLASKIKEAGYTGANVVPVPASDHIDPSHSFTGLRIAEAIEAVEPNFKPAPVLYFGTMQEKSASGGTRNPHQIKQHLRMVASLDGPVVLLDDVCTTGGHLKAAARVLRDQGHEVQDAFVVGRTAWSKPDKMFRVATEEVVTSSVLG